MKKLFIIIFVVALLFPLFQTVLAQSSDLKENEIFNQSPITVQKGTQLLTELVDEINLKKTRLNDKIKFKLLANYAIDEHIIFFQNSIFTGTVVEIGNESLLHSYYKIAVDIDSVSVPFRGNYSIKAHPDFELRPPKKSKGHLFSFGNARQKQDDIINETSMDRKKQPTNTEQQLIIPAGKEIKITLDEDFEY